MAKRNSANPCEKHLNHHQLKTQFTAVLEVLEHEEILNQVLETRELQYNTCFYLHVLINEATFALR